MTASPLRLMLNVAPSSAMRRATRPLGDVTTASAAWAPEAARAKTAVARWVMVFMDV